MRCLCEGTSNIGSGLKKHRLLPIVMASICSSTRLLTPTTSRFTLSVLHRLMAKANQQKLLFGDSPPEGQEEKKASKVGSKPAFIETDPPVDRPGTVVVPEVDESLPFEWSELADKKIVVVDSHSLIYQVFHAMAPMTSPDGRTIHAVYGFTRDILDIIKKYQPDYLICAFDRSEITFRNELYDQYKAHRDPMPDDLRSQIPMIRQLVDALAIPILDLDGYEADDILGDDLDFRGSGGGQLLVGDQ